MKILKFFNGLLFGVNASKIEDYGFGDEGEFSGFAKYFDENIRPKTLLFEEIRLKNLRRFLLSYRIVIVVLAGLWYSFFAMKNGNYFGQKEIETYSTWVLGISFVMMAFPLMFIQKFDEEVKKNLYSEIFKFYKFDYYPEGSKRFMDYDSFGLMPRYDPFYSSTEDLVLGNYKTVPFRLEELKLAYETGSGKRRRKVITFIGVVIMLRFNKNFSGRTVVKSDLGMIGNFSRKAVEGKLSGLEKVSLEDPEFEKIFEVYSNNQIEARYLLTSAFMERLKRLSKFFEAKKLEASFYNDALLLQFSSKLDLFSVQSIFDPINAVADSRKVLQQITLIEDLIDVLQLDEKTGL